MRCRTRLRLSGESIAACVAALDSCMESCGENGDPDFTNEDDFSLDGFNFSQCWQFGFNGTCPGLARELEVCGGSLVPGSHEECMESCKATTGAWVDDLDLICVEACD